MNALPMTHERYEQLRAEHAEICDLVATMYRVLAERNAPTSRVCHLLESLTERIQAHFQDEEACGLFEDLARQRPEDIQAIQAISREHGDLARRLTALATEAAEGSLDAARWESLERGFRDFGTSLDRHESRENEMLLDAYENDLGNQD